MITTIYRIRFTRADSAGGVHEYVKTTRYHSWEEARNEAEIAYRHDHSFLDYEILEEQANVCWLEFLCGMQLSYIIGFLLLGIIGYVLFCMCCIQFG